MEQSGTITNQGDLALTMEYNMHRLHGPCGRLGPLTAALDIGAMTLPWCQSRSSLPEP